MKSNVDKKPRSRRESVIRKPPGLVYCLTVLFGLQKAMDNPTELVKIIEANGRKASRFLGLRLLHTFVAAKALESLNESSEHRIRTRPLDPDKLQLLLKSEDVRVPLRTAVHWMEMARKYPTFEDFQEVLKAKPPRTRLTRSSAKRPADSPTGDQSPVENPALPAESAGRTGSDPRSQGL